jgi:hypothetical protein
MRPIPDVIKIGGPNIFLYRNRQEFIGQIKFLMDNPASYTIDLRHHSWKEKSRQMEILLQRLV